MTGEEPQRVAGIPVVVDPAVPENTVLLVPDLQRQLDEWAAKYERLILERGHPTTRRERVEFLAAMRDVPACSIAHAWTPWAYDGDRDWWARSCERDHCDAGEYRAARLGAPND